MPAPAESFKVRVKGRRGTSAAPLAERKPWGALGGAVLGGALWGALGAEAAREAFPLVDASAPKPAFASVDEGRVTVGDRHHPVAAPSGGRISNARSHPGLPAGREIAFLWLGAEDRGGDSRWVAPVVLGGGAEPGHAVGRIGQKRPAREPAQSRSP